jgi:co-chaperonin GroES (HSP10)
MQMKPTGNKILIEIIAKEEAKTQSGLIIPDNVDLGLQLQKAKVVAVGPGDRSLFSGNIIPLDLSEGDIVYIGQAGRFHGYKVSDSIYLTDVKEVLAKD